MTDTSVPPGRHSAVDPLLPALFFFSPILICLVPHLTVVFLPAICAALIESALRRGQTWTELLRPDAALAALLLLAAYVLVSAIWAPSRGSALGKGVLLLVAILGALAAARAVSALEEVRVRRFALSFAAGAFLAALYLLVEFLSGGAVHRAIFVLEPALQSGSTRFAGEGTRFDLSWLNDNLMLSMFWMWPGLLALLGLSGFRSRLLLAAVFFLVSAAAALLSVSLAAKVALIASSLVFLLAWVQPRGAVWAVAVIWCASFALVLPAVATLSKPDSLIASWLPPSAQGHLPVWNQVADRVSENIWLGAGVRATPRLMKTLDGEAPASAANVQADHADAYSPLLQTWYELGFVGAVLAALAGAALVLRSLAFAKGAQAFLPATFTAAALALFGHELWQSWLVWGVALVPIYLSVAAAGAAARDA